MKVVPFLGIGWIRFLRDIRYNPRVKRTKIQPLTLNVICLKGSKMNEHQCTSDCGNKERFEILSHPANPNRIAVCCQDCGNIWLVDYEPEEREE
jgi:hypothetical protein